MIRIHELNFDLPEWTEQDFKRIRSAEEKLVTLRKKAGVGSGRFHEACKKLRIGINSGKSPEQLIATGIDVRAFTYLLSREHTFYNEITIDQELLEHLESIKSPMSRLSLVQFIGSYFKHFDLMANGADLDVWSHFFTKQLEFYGKGKRTSELARYANYSELIFCKEGPVKLTQKAQSDQIDFDGLLKRFGLTGYADGRFPKLCKFQYYLYTLQKIEVGEDHPILQELCKPDVINSPYQEGKLLGHAFIEILIDRSSGTVLSQSWQNVVLGIAGDPRVPKSHHSYQKWWALLGDQRIALMRGWLSRFDLKLFLAVLEQAAKDGGEHDMERMFAPRKYFMEGLLEEGLIVNSRLFLSSQAEHYLLRNYRKEDLPAYARISGGQTPMIYLNIANRVHMIEGSHSFTLKMLDQLPSNSRLADYSIDRVRDRQIRMGELESYHNEFPTSHRFLEQRHIDLTWQHNAIQFMKDFGIDIHPAKVIREDYYRAYKLRYWV